MVSTQNSFLALPFSHNWRYLWSSQHAPSWAVAILVPIFFIGVWALMLALFGGLSNRHSFMDTSHIRRGPGSSSMETDSLEHVQRRMLAPLGRIITERSIGWLDTVDLAWYS